MLLFNGVLYSDHTEAAAAVSNVCLWTGVVFCVKMWLIGAFKLLLLSLLCVEAEAATTTRSVVSDGLHEMRHDSSNHELQHTGNLEFLLEHPGASALIESLPDTALPEFEKPTPRKRNPRSVVFQRPRDLEMRNRDRLVFFDSVPRFSRQRRVGPSRQAKNERITVQR